MRRTVNGAGRQAVVAPVPPDEQETLERPVAARTRELRESEARYRRLLQATDGFVFTAQVDARGETRLVCEPGIGRLTGYPPKAFEAHPELWKERVHPEDRARVDNQLDGIRRGESIAVLEHRIVHRDGGIRWVRSALVARAPARRGRRFGYDGLITDITTQKRFAQERDEAMTELAELATRDEMTGLLNHRALDRELRRTWEMAQRHAFPLGLLVIDLDHFKSINDTYGHLVGDTVLRECAALVQAAVREDDIVFRYAGDELVVILPWAGLDNALEVGERLLKEVRNHLFCKGEQDVALTVSIGAGACRPCPGRTVQQLLGLADRALYRAKQTGRNRVACVETEAAEAEPEADGEARPRACRTHGRVLVVDDDDAIGRLLQRLLDAEGYETCTTRSIAEALEALVSGSSPIGVALIDLHLNGESGFTLLERLRATDDLVVPVVITGQATMDAAVESLRVGAFDFLSKPLKPDRLSIVVQRAMVHHRLQAQNRRYEEHLEAMVRRQGIALSRSLEKEKQSHQIALEVIASLIGRRETRTGAHCRRVARFSVMLAGKLGVTPEDIEHLRRGALLHDLGKIGIPDAILLKAGPLSEGEWSIMQTHAQMGYQVIAPSPALKGAAEIVLAHHEHFDGNGYPRGLAGENICRGARILAVADAYDAMRSARPYQPRRLAAEALEEIMRNRGTQFDPAVADVLLACQPRIESEGRWDGA